MSAVETLKAYRTIHNADNVDDAIAEIQRCYERIDELGGEIDRLRDRAIELELSMADLIRTEDSLRAENAELRAALEGLDKHFVFNVPPVKNEVLMADGMAAEFQAAAIILAKTGKGG